MTLKPIEDIVKNLGMESSDVRYYGKNIAKLNLSSLAKYQAKSDDDNTVRSKGKYVLVTGITPTKRGEGKTVITIGLSQALNKIGRTSTCTIRESSMGPLFGVKGGSVGGGISQVQPAEEINLHFTGDFHAVSSANNLLASLVDNHMFHPQFPRKNQLNLVPSSVTWNRVIGINDASLRKVRIGNYSDVNVAGYPRDSGFMITAASEVMSILSLAEGMDDLKKRLSNITVGKNKAGDFVTAKHLKSVGAMTVLLKDAICPNIVQTSENTPCLIHMGPFANLSIGANSVIADRVALAHSQYVITEAGFGTDVGAEKFVDIKCRSSGLVPDCMVLVATIQTLRYHGLASKFYSDKDFLEKEDQEEIYALSKNANPDAAAEGCSHLIKHADILRNFGIPVVVCINKFSSDTDQEIEVVRDKMKEAGIETALADVWQNGGEGGVELAESVTKICNKSNPGRLKFLYPDDMSLHDKVETLAKRIYGASSVKFSTKTKNTIEELEGIFGNLPICTAKTHLSITHDAAMLDVPDDGYQFPVNDVRVASGAGFVNVISGDIETMPGLPSSPAATGFDLDEEGNVLGMI